MFEIADLRNSGLESADPHENVCCHCRFFNGRGRLMLMQVNLTNTLQVDRCQHVVSSRHQAELSTFNSLHLNSIEIRNKSKYLTWCAWSSSDWTLGLTREVCNTLIHRYNTRLITLYNGNGTNTKSVNFPQRCLIRDSTHILSVCLQNWFKLIRFGKLKVLFCLFAQAGTDFLTKNTAYPLMIICSLGDSPNIFASL